MTAVKLNYGVSTEAQGLSHHLQCQNPILECRFDSQPEFDS